MSILRSSPTGITGIINVLFNFDQFSKNIEKHSASRRKMPFSSKVNEAERG